MTIADELYLDELRNVLRHAHQALGLDLQPNHVFSRLTRTERRNAKRRLRRMILRPQAEGVIVVLRAALHGLEQQPELGAWTTAQRETRRSTRDAVAKFLAEIE